MVLAARGGQRVLRHAPARSQAETEDADGLLTLRNAALAAKHALDHTGLGRGGVGGFRRASWQRHQDLLWTEARRPVLLVAPGAALARSRRAGLKTRRNDNVVTCRCPGQREPDARALRGGVFRGCRAFARAAE